jgi:hypothetical protein
MKFKEVQFTENLNIVKASPSGITPRKDKAFHVNTASMTGTLADIVPSEIQGWLAEIGAGLGGIDLTRPLTWTKDKVIGASEKARSLDKKLLELSEVKTAVTKYLAYSMKEAEFLADITVAAAKAKIHIDKEAARAHLAYMRYLRKAARLEKRTQATQEIIDSSNRHLEATLDGRKAAILASLNENQKLVGASDEAVQEMRRRRQRLLQSHRQEMAAYKAELKGVHTSLPNS